MRDPYFHKKAIEHNDSLLSPPLTPIEAQSSWYVPRKRKNFIGSYARMAPLLRPSYSAIGNDRIFALNVYRDLLLIDSTDSISTNKNKNSSKDNKQCSSNRIVIEQNDCAMSDKAVVSPTKRRRTVSEVDKKRKRNSSSSVLPTGKDAAAAFDAINIDLSDDCFYPQDWVPSVEALDFVPVKVSWKGKYLVFQL
jgi:hypothetical protein